MISVKSPVPILGFAAYSGTGKTTLLKTIIPLLKTRGIRLGIIKHAHHAFDIDHPGKDSYELRKAGADTMLIASKNRWALMVENEGNDDSIRNDPLLQDLINRLDTDALDIILVEGFKHESFPKIELNRAEQNNEYLYPTDPTIIAIATDTEMPKAELPKNSTIKQLNINNPEQIAAFIYDNFLNDNISN